MRVFYWDVFVCSLRETRPQCMRPPPQHFSPHAIHIIPFILSLLTIPCAGNGAEVHWSCYENLWFPNANRWQTASRICWGVYTLQNSTQLAHAEYHYTENCDQYCLWNQCSCFLRREHPTPIKLGGGLQGHPNACEWEGGQPWLHHTRRSSIPNRLWCSFT